MDRCTQGVGVEGKSVRSVVSRPRATQSMRTFTSRWGSVPDVVHVVIRWDGAEGSARCGRRRTCSRLFEQRQLPSPRGRRVLRQFAMPYARYREVAPAGARLHFVLTLCMGRRKGWWPSKARTCGTSRCLDAKPRLLLSSECLHGTEVILLLLTGTTNACLIHGKTGLRVGGFDGYEEGGIMSSTEVVEMGFGGGSWMVVLCVVGIRVHMRAAARIVHILFLLERQDGEVNWAVRRGQGAWDRGDGRCSRGRDGVAASTGELHGHISVHSPLPFTSIRVVGIVGPGQSGREARAGVGDRRVDIRDIAVAPPKSNRRMRM